MAALAVQAQQPSQQPLPSQSSQVPTKQATSTPQPQQVQPSTNAQSGVELSDINKLTVESYMNMKLPPLYDLLERARNSAQVEQYRASKEMEERELKSVRRSWLDGVKLNAGYDYGSMNSYNTMAIEGDPYYTYSASGREQSWWSIGASFTLPLTQIFDRNNRIKKQKKRIESINYEMERYHDEISLLIIEDYTSATMNLAMLNNAAKTMMQAQAQYELSELDFLNGQMSPQELGNQRAIQDNATQNYYKILAELNKSLLRLEVLTHSKLIGKIQ